MCYIETIVNNVGNSDSNISKIPQNKERAKRKAHVDCMTKVGGADE